MIDPPKNPPRAKRIVVDNGKVRMAFVWWPWKHGSKEEAARDAQAYIDKCLELGESVTIGD